MAVSNLTFHFHVIIIELFERNSVERDKSMELLEENEAVSVVKSEVHDLHIVICDDETDQIENMVEVLQQAGWNVAFSMEKFSSSKELLEILLERAQKGEAMPDIVFSDIKMPEVDGISFGKRLHQIAPECFLVFTTAYAEYAIEGYEAQAFRYLLKPISVDEVRGIIHKILLEMGERYKLFVKAKEEYLLSLRDVLYLGAEDKYTVIYTNRGYHVTRISLAEYEKKLEDYGFCRIHRKYMVNTFHHYAMGNGKIELSNGQQLPISRRRKDAYYQKIMKQLEKDLLR